MREKLQMQTIQQKDPVEYPWIEVWEHNDTMGAQ